MLKETSDPSIELAMGVGVVALDHSSEVRHFFRVVGERIVPCSVLQQDFRPLERRVLQCKTALDPEARCTSREVRDCYTIVEDVVDPPQSLRAGLNIESCFDEPLIVAIARAQHHPVLSQPDGRGVRVGGDMFYR